MKLLQNQENTGGGCYEIFSGLNVNPGTILLFCCFSLLREISGINYFIRLKTQARSELSLFLGKGLQIL
jgi:hypothetical protein